jgi:four helix bundle protein
MDQEDLKDRLFNFAVRTIKYLRNLPNTPEYTTIRYQLSKSSNSAGANYEEAQAASSRADFNNKVKISLKEMRESNYWYRVIYATVPDDLKTDELVFLLNESGELKKILGSIAAKTNN